MVSGCPLRASVKGFGHSLMEGPLPFSLAASLSLSLFLFLFLLQFSYYIRHHVRFAKRVIVQDLHTILF
jgi:hypothetical protein